LYKELSTKLAWSVGSTLGLTYGRRSKVLEWASERAAYIIRHYATLSNSQKAGL
jgi:hypothetical protein